MVTEFKRKVRSKMFDNANPFFYLCFFSPGTGTINERQLILVYYVELDNMHATHNIEHRTEPSKHLKS